jgi:hypothetical protein
LGKVSEDGDCVELFFFLENSLVPGRITTRD